MYRLILAAAGLAAMTAPALADSVTLTPNDLAGVDEDMPRIAYGDAPTPEFGPDSWVNSATGKVNAYVGDGVDASGVFSGTKSLFGRQVGFSEITAVSYYTKPPTDAGDDDWFVNFYTEADGVDDNAGWYGKRFTLVAEQSALGNGWFLNTVTGFKSTSGSTSGTTFSFSQLATNFAGEMWGAISPQTNSGDKGSDAQIDGLRVELSGGEVGTVDFAAASVPSPSIAMGGLILAGVTALRRRK